MVMCNFLEQERRKEKASITDWVLYRLAMKNGITEMEYAK